MSLTETKKKEEKKQCQGQGQLTYDPNNPDPSRKRVQLAKPAGEKPKKKGEKE